MLSEAKIKQLNAGQYNLITVYDAMAKWDANKKEFFDVRMATGTHTFTPKELVDTDVRIYVERFIWEMDV